MPAAPIELRHIDGLPLDYLSLHFHLMKNALLEEALRFNDFLLDRGVLNEFFPDLVG